MDFQVDRNNLRIILEANTERERRYATPIIENGRVLTVVLAFLGVVTSPIPIVGTAVAVLTLISSLTGIIRVVYAKAEMTSASANSLTATASVEYTDDVDEE